MKSYVNWRGRFKQLGQWFDKEAAVEKWLADYDAKAAELAARIRDMIGDETFAVLEANSVHFGSYYIYRSGGPGELVYDELKLTPSAPAFLIILAALVLLLGFSMVLSVCTGIAGGSFKVFAETVMSPAKASGVGMIMLEMRMPRALAAGLTGMAFVCRI